MSHFQRACIFIDGENLRHSLIELFCPPFRREHYLPNGSWQNFFNMLVNDAEAETRIRTYWYVVQHLDFWLWKLPEHEPEKLIRVLSKHPPYATQLSRLSGDEKVQRALGLRTSLLARRRGMHSRFNGWIAIQDGIASRVDALEFRRAGSVTYNLFKGTLGTEKAVDVKLATDLLELRPIYDLAIIVSGDQDYVPSVQAIKDSGKRVLNVCFLKRDGDLLPGGARRLNQITDRVLLVPYEQLRELMGFPAASEPAEPSPAETS